MKASTLSVDVQALINALPNPLFVKNRKHRMVMLNDHACAFFGHSREVMLSRSDEELYPADQVAVFHTADDLVFATAAEHESEELVTDASGLVRTVITRKRMVRFSGLDYLIGVVTDVTDYRAAEARNRYLAFHDILTGLPNRTLFDERMDQACQRDTKQCALLYVDLDRFKEVNDSHGHHAGDKLIAHFAQRLSGLVRACDTVARLGGDEFGILLAGANDEIGIEEICKRILLASSQPFDLSGTRVRIGASIGAVFAAGEKMGRDELQRRADVALYQAKDEGRGCWRLFTPEMDSRVKQCRLMELDLRHALSSGGELEIHYQPIASVESGRVEGFEALARWHHPTRGLIMPGDFIPVAETSGLIVPFGEWVLRKACVDAASWDPPLRLSVNISPVQVVQGDLADVVERALRDSHLDPTRLELEVTETVLIDDAPRALAVLNQIRALGVRIVLDDFGTGYSSLVYLRRFPFDKIKIDRGFIADMLKDTHALSIVQAVISLVQGLNLQIVAEGVETAEQFDRLRQLGCTQAQGYLISPAMPIGYFAGSVLREDGGAGAQVKAARRGRG